MVTNQLFPDSRTRVEREVHRRIKLTVWAYAYEIANTSLVSDDEFDRECMAVDVRIDTGRPELDEWWRGHFQAHTGQWIHGHPELARVAELFNNEYRKAA